MLTYEKYVVSWCSVGMEGSREFMTLQGASMFTRLLRKVVDSSCIGMEYIYSGVTVWSYDLDGDFADFPNGEEY